MTLKVIEVEEVLTPLDLASRFNSYKGIAFGLSHDLLQTNYFRPHHQSDEFERLYFVVIAHIQEQEFL